MNPLAIRLRSFRTFEYLDLDLPEGCCAIVGRVLDAGATDSNGAGKSSLVNAIEVSLFGPESRSWKGYLTRGDETELTVELTFTHAGETYRVRRGYSARGAGKSTLDLERFEMEWTPLTLGSAKETQALIEQILGFSRRTFRASSFLMQRDASAFTLADPRDRKRILADTLGLDRFDLLLAAVRRDRKTHEGLVARIDGRLEGVTAEGLAAERAALEARLAELAIAEEAATAALAQAEAALEHATVAWQAEQTASAERAAALARRDAATAALSAKQATAQAASEATALADAARAELAALPAAQTADLEQREADLTAQLDAHRETVRAREETLRLRTLRELERGTITAQADLARRKTTELDEKIGHLASGTLDSCPTCQQSLGAAARAATIGSLRAQAQTASDEASALDERAAAIEIPDVPEEPAPCAAGGELETIRAQIRQAHEGELRRASLDERIAGHQRTIDAAAVPEYVVALADAREALERIEASLVFLPAPADIAALERDGLIARNAVNLERSRLAETQQAKAIEAERLAQHTAREAQLTADLAARAEHHARLDLLAILERAYGPDGIPALILENRAIPQIETETARLLALLGGPVSRVELRTQRENADGAIADALDIVCVTDTGDCDFKDLSGGEQFRVDLALRVALSQLLGDCDLIVIDEPDGLDASGKQALIEILRDLELRGKRRLYLISHDSDLRDSFEQTIEVVKEAGRSRVEGAAVEAVAA